LKLKALLVAYGLFMLLFEATLSANFALEPNALGTVVNDSSYPSGSWGLGIVVPEGSQLEGGGHLSWENASAITATIRLPNISYTDNTILAVLSAMASDGAVLQVAAGIYPNMSSWLAYAWFIRNPESYSQPYAWVLNSSNPEMAPGSWVSLSIYTSSNLWRYRVEDITTHQTVKGKFAFNITPSFRVGDQEVFALESYSYSNHVFEHMGSLVLSSLFVNGMRITKGEYYYADWDRSHNPLFVVGGLNPPSSISLHEFANGTIAWTYSQWTGSGESLRVNWVLVTLAVLPVVVAITVSIAILTLRKRIN
jgi:hypothetical protein